MAAPRIQWRLLASYLVLLLFALGPAVALLGRWLGSDARAEIQADLGRQASLLAAELERAPPADPAAWVRGLRPHLESRVTVIAPDGRVLGDSQVPAAELPRLESHAGRDEVAAALGGQRGVALRRSATLDLEMLYVAVPVGSPPRWVLRLALPLQKVQRVVGRAQAAAASAGALALALAGVVGAVLARRVVQPVITMTHAARAMTRGDFSAPLPRPSLDELGDLTGALGELRRQLAAHIEELHAEGEKLRAVLNGMSEGVALVQEGRIVLANPAFTELLAMDRGAEGLRPPELSGVPELAEAVEAVAARRGSPGKEIAVRGRTLGLQVRPLGGSKAGANSGAAVVVLLDLSDAKRLERVRRDFVANASHELRTPVAAIIGAAETLAAGAASDPQACASFVRILERHAQRLSRLTADLLDLSRLEAGYRPRVERMPVAAALGPVLLALRPRAEEKGIALRDELPADLPEVGAERAALEQILTNLIDNAIKYTQPGGRVTIDAEPIGQARPRVRITVADTGPGIPAEHLPRLFERFYRVDSARSRELGGTGLGLSIVRHLALALGGEVAVDSEVGKGSRFHVTLPCALPPSGQSGGAAGTM